MDTGLEHLPEFSFERDPAAPFDPPPQRMRWLREEGLPRVRLWNEKPAWVVTRYADQRVLQSRQCLSADDRHANYPYFSAGLAAGGVRTLITMDGDEHSEHRGRFREAFSARRLRRLAPRIEAIVTSALDAMEEQGPPCDLVTAFALPVPSRVICELLGVPYEDHAFFEQAAAEITDATSGPQTARAAWQRLGTYLADLADAKAEKPENDLMSELARNLASGRVSREECANDSILLLLGGHETTANMITLGTSMLLQHPEALAQVRHGGPETVAAAVDELARLLSVAQGGRRRVATTDIEISGSLIRAGDAVILAADAANRDPDAFEDPDELKIDRQARHHLGFGHGAHRCLGETLGRMELEAALPALLRRFPTLRLDRPLEELRFRTDLMIYGLFEMPVTW
ncbi:cytochrome P450 [Streptomyces sp. LRE541]|uniref:cytochrome P450 n=1 Tax=Streptomyces sp. LRE541 TaxID=2931983 RepID=UPI00200C13A8|nr:cytochrome P450 [Streptomyces sp. LRE541]UPZ33867.1 cytochrome P450 [Streptomyces sp. LRE541]